MFLLKKLLSFLELVCLKLYIQLTLGVSGHHDNVAQSPDVDGQQVSILHQKVTPFQNHFLSWPNGLTELF